MPEALRKDRFLNTVGLPESSRVVQIRSYSGEAVWPTQLGVNLACPLIFLVSQPKFHQSHPVFALSDVKYWICCLQFDITNPHRNTSSVQYPRTARR